MDSLKALGYLDDIAHGRKMEFDAHELKLIVEKDIKALNIIKRCPLEVVDYIEIYDSWEEYSQDYYRKERWIKTKEEFDLLKEMLS